MDFMEPVDIIQVVLMAAFTLSGTVYFILGSMHLVGWL